MTLPVFTLPGGRRIAVNPLTISDVEESGSGRTVICWPVPEDSYSVVVTEDFDTVRRALESSLTPGGQTAATVEFLSAMVGPAAACINAVIAAAESKKASKEH